MGEENDMAIQQWQDHEAHNSLLRLMRISNEFDIMKDSMEMFPLPGNMVEPHIDHNSGFEHQANVREVGKEMRTTDLLTSLSLSSDVTKHKIKELVENAKDELTQMLIEREPFWQQDVDRGFEVLNKVEYVKKFDTNLETTLEEIIKIIAVDAPLDHDFNEVATNYTHKHSSDEVLSVQDYDVSKPSPRTTEVRQASRYMGYIEMPAICLVEVLMDVRLWSFVFSEMLSRAAVLGVLSPGAQGTHNDALVVMTSEYQCPCPLLATWQSCFARHCKELSPNMWLIVDISLEAMFHNPLMTCKRRPSGCLVQGLLDGNTTQISWIEHTEVEMGLIHPLLKPTVESGYLFSARKWVDTLFRQCQRLDSIMKQCPNHGVNEEDGCFRVEGLLRLAGRMRRQFYGAMSAAKGNGYKPMAIPGGDDILFSTFKQNDQGLTLYTIATSSWFPFTRKKVFDFLGDDKNRTKWDLLAREHKTHELYHVYSSQGTQDVLSITKLVDKNGRVDTFFLQDKHETDVGSYIIMSPITYDSVASLSSHGNINEIPLLPSGFAILSNTQPGSQEDESNGCIITLSFQLISSSSKQHVPPSVTRKLYNLVTDTISLIRGALFEPPPTSVNQEDAKDRSVSF